MLLNTTKAINRNQFSELSKNLFKGIKDKYLLEDKIMKRYVYGLLTVFFLLLIISEFCYAAETLSPSPPITTATTTTATATQPANLTTLTLTECIDITNSHHPTLVSAREAINIAKLQKRQAQSSYYPQVNVSSDYNRSKVEGSESNKSLAASGSVSQLIYDFGKTPASVRETDENINIELQNYYTTELTILLNVKTAYYTVLRTKEGVTIAQEALDNAKLHLKLADRSYTIGIVAKLDVAKAQVEVANAELSLVSAKNDYLVSIRSLNNAMGLDTNTYETIDLPETPYSTVSIELPQFILAALRDRPDVRIFKNQREQLKAGLLIAERGHFPTISASGNYSQSGNITPLKDSWSGNLGLSFSLFNGFNTESQIQVAKANLRNLDSLERKMIQDVQLDVATNYLNVKSGEEKIKAAQSLVDQAKESLQLATGRYQNGLGSFLDLTDAQVSYSNARVSLAQSVYAYQINLAQLQKSIGQK
jgi:outer membrane protein